MYALELLPSTKKDFKQLHKKDIAFIKNSLYDFVQNFNHTYEQQLLQNGKIKKLKGYDEPLYRLKLRTYRVIYKKEENRLIILVLNIKSREGSYKK